MMVRWTDTAIAEVNQILSYIAADNPSAAAAVANEINEVVLRVSEYPEFARVVYKSDVRAVSVGRFEYRLFYIHRGQELIIRNVRSMKRRRPWEK